VHQQRKSFAPRDPQLRRSPNSIGLAEIVADDFPVFHAAIMRSYDLAGNVIEMHEHAGDFKEP
jgi:hypothetical protein